MRNSVNMWPNDALLLLVQLVRNIQDMSDLGDLEYSLIDSHDIERHAKQSITTAPE